MLTAYMHNERQDHIAPTAAPLDALTLSLVSLSATQPALAASVCAALRESAEPSNWSTRRLPRCRLA